MKQKPLWTVKTLRGITTVSAWTRSEARALAKRIFEYAGRLPVGVTITRREIQRAP